MCSGENFRMYFLSLQLCLAVESFPGPCRSWGFSMRKRQPLCSEGWAIGGGFSLCLFLQPQQRSVGWAGSFQAAGKSILRGSLWLSP